MSYLIKNDLKRFIQSDNLNQVINADASILLNAMLDAQDIAKENLRQKYEIGLELTDTEQYDPAEAGYGPGSRVYINPSAYNPASTYIVGSFVLQAGNVYKNTTAITVPETFNATKWALIGLQYDIYYVPLPYPLFDITKSYAKGDLIFWNGKVYTNILASTSINHDYLLQQGTYAAAPQINVIPDDPKSGLASWGAGVLAPVAAGVLPTSWTAGDNRNRSLVRHLISIALYIIHDRVSPRVVPTIRTERYKDAMRWLKDASEGNITADIQKIQPRSGGRIRWGSNVKNINNY